MSSSSISPRRKGSARTWTYVVPMLRALAARRRGTGFQGTGIGAPDPPSGDATRRREGGGAGTLGWAALLAELVPVDDEGEASAATDDSRRDGDKLFDEILHEFRVAREDQH